MKPLICALALAASTVLAAEPQRLERLHTHMQALTKEGGYLGAVTLVAHKGRIVDWQAYGYRDLSRHDKMARDAIFRIYSMSKTVTAVAVMTLVEEGKLGLDEPLGRYLPAFAAPTVFAGGTADAPQLRPAKGALTVRQLLTHTPGFAVFGDSGAPVNVIFNRADLDHAPDLAQFAARLAPLPLAHDPGAAFHYDGVPTKLLGHLVEVVSGMPFDRYLETRIFKPLGMRDTGFTVPAAKRARIADMTTTDALGELAAPAPGTVPAAGERMNPYLSGAGGLYSTAPDYAKFAQMLLDGGGPVLGRKSVELMMQNHLSQLVPPTIDAAGAEGFGLGGSVVVDVSRRGRLGSNGQFGWSGAAGTYYTVDPKERLVAILLTQHLPQGLPTDPPKASATFYNLVYQALGK